MNVFSEEYMGLIEVAKQAGIEEYGLEELDKKVQEVGAKIIDLSGNKIGYFQIIVLHRLLKSLIKVVVQNIEKT